MSQGGNALVYLTCAAIGLAAALFELFDNGRLSWKFATIFLILILAIARAVVLLRRKHVSTSNDTLRAGFVGVGFLLNLWFVLNIPDFQAQSLSVVAALICGITVSTIIYTARAPSISRPLTYFACVTIVSTLVHVEDWQTAITAIAGVATVASAWRFMRAHHSDLMQTDRLFRRAADAKSDLEYEIEKTARLARTDELTSIGNRRAFMEGAADILDDARRDGAEIMVAVLDLNKFKQINDTYGHEVGDEVIRAAAANLAATAAPGWCAARLGGDEYALALRVDSSEAPGRIATRVFSKLKTSIDFGGQTLSFGWAMGYCVARIVGDVDLCEVMRVADASLYRSKILGGPVGANLNEEANSMIA